MQRPPLILGAAVFGALALAAPADAACNPALANVPAGTAHIYDGVIGDTPARLALIFGKDGAIEGRYALATSTADIVVRGKLEPGGERMTLTELDTTGQPRAVFAGVFPEIEPWSGNSGGAVFGGPPPGSKDEKVPGWVAIPSPNGTKYVPPPLACTLIVGSLQETAGRSLELKLRRSDYALEHPQFGHLYAIAGVTDDEVVNRNAQAFRNAIAANKREEVVKHFRFPIARTIRGQLVLIENEKGLLARYDDFFPQHVRDNFARIVPRMMQASEVGVMLAPGIWLDQDGYIISF